MTVIRLCAGFIFLVMAAALVFVFWRATREWKPEGKTKWGAVDPETVRAIEARRHHSR